MSGKTITWVRNHPWLTVLLGSFAALGMCLVWLLVIDVREVRLFALDAQTGRVEWSALLPDKTRYPAEPAVSAGRVVISLSYEGKRGNENTQSVIAFDAASGKKLWEYAPEASTGRAMNEEVPYVFDETVYARTADDDSDTLVALDLASGRLKWKQSFALNAAESPVVAVGQSGERLVGVFEGEKSYALSTLDPRTGARISDIKGWSIENDREYFDPPRGPFLLANDRSVFLSTNKALYALDPQTGAPQFEVPGSLRIRIDGSTLYAGSATTVKALDAATGAERWLYTIPVPGLSYFTTIQAASGTVYVLCSVDDVDQEYWLIALDAQNGRERWLRPVSNAFIYMSAAVTNVQDVVIVPGGTGRQAGIMALSVKDGSERWHFVTRSSAQPRTPVTDGNRVFLVDKSSRWRSWLSLINPAWH